MGSQRIKTPQGDNQNNKPSNGGHNNNNNQQQRPRSNNTVIANTQTRKGEVFRAQRRTSEDVNMRASQHLSTYQSTSRYITAMAVVSSA